MFTGQSAAYQDPSPSDWALKELGFGRYRHGSSPAKIVVASSSGIRDSTDGSDSRNAFAASVVRRLR